MDKQKAFKAGYDCGYNGANKTNCHFSVFSTNEFTKEWERGKKLGEAKIIEENEASLSKCCKKPLSNEHIDNDIIFYCSKCNRVHSVTSTGFKLPNKQNFYKSKN